MNIPETLIGIGLTNNEVTVYLLLFEHGTKPGNEIISETKLEKSSAYKALKSLAEKGFIVSTGSIRKQVFTAIPAIEVVKKFNDKINEVEASKKAFLRVAEELSLYASDKYKSDSITVYTGKFGNLHYHKDLLNTQTVFIKTLASTQTQHTVVGDKEYEKMNRWFISQRVAQGIPVSVLYDQSARPDKYDKSNKSLLKECRQLPYQLELPSTLSITNKSVFFSTVKGKAFWGIQIEDRTIAILLNSMYGALWLQANLVK